MASSPPWCFLCGVTSDSVILCPRCRNAHSCHAHLGQHRPAGQCRPFRIESRPLIGRFVVAARDIHPGELILRDASVASGPKEVRLHSGSACVVCLRVLEDDGRSRRCTECQLHVCQDSAGTGNCREKHVAECRDVFRHFSKEEEDVSLAAVTPYRLWKAQALDSELKLRLDLLMDHAAHRSRQEAHSARTEQVSELLTKALAAGGGQGDQSLERKALDRCAGLLFVNALDVPGSTGRLLFPTFSFLSHSCANNARHVLVGKGQGEFEISLYSQTPISEGEEITITYTNLLRHAHARRTRLQTQWAFWCRCKRCQDPAELGTFVNALKCPSCRAGVLLPRDGDGDKSAAAKNINDNNDACDGDKQGDGACEAHYNNSQVASAIGATDDSKDVSAVNATDNSNDMPYAGDHDDDVSAGDYSDSAKNPNNFCEAHYHAAENSQVKSASSATDDSNDVPYAGADVDDANTNDDAGADDDDSADRDSGASWHCLACQTIVPLRAVENLVTDTLLPLLPPSQSPAADYEEFLRLTEPLLHENHYLRLIAKRYLTQLYDDKDAAQRERKAQLCLDLMAVFDVLDPGISQSRGLTLLELTRAEMAGDGDLGGVSERLELIDACLSVEPECSVAGRRWIKFKAEVGGMFKK